jgi:prepilin-type N-terminal cleavage/methylation domain-containing protein
MKTREMLNKKTNNKGMTLVEVIISVTILSIVIVPTLSVLTSAMAYNVKAKKRQQATITAESIMEAFKGYDIETLEKQFNDGTFRADGITVTPEAATDGSSTGEGTEDSSTATEKNYSCKKDIDGKYTFEIKEYEDNDRKYKVEIVATPSSNADADLYIQYNMNSLYSGIYKGSKLDGDEVESRALEDFKNNHYEGELLPLALAKCTSGMQPTDIAGGSLSKSNMNLTDSNVVIVGRKLTFDISETKKEDGESYATIVPQMEYQYYIEKFVFYAPTKPANPKDPLDDDTYLVKSGGVLYASKEETIERYPENSSETLTFTVTSSAQMQCDGIESGNLKSLYIYYYPYYESEDKTDEIVINNNLGKEVSCYVLKQKESDTALNLANFLNLETNYKPMITTSGSVTVYHNLNINLAKNDYFDTKVIDNATKGNCYDIADIKRDKNESSKKAVVSSKQSKTTNLLYKVELTMTDVETGDDVAKLESVMYEK